MINVFISPHDSIFISSPFWIRHALPCDFYRCIVNIWLYIYIFYICWAVMLETWKWDAVKLVQHQQPLKKGRISITMAMQLAGASSATPACTWQLGFGFPNESTVHPIPKIIGFPQRPSKSPIWMWFDLFWSTICGTVCFGPGPWWCAFSRKARWAKLGAPPSCAGSTEGRGMAQSGEIEIGKSTCPHCQNLVSLHS